MTRNRQLILTFILVFAAGFLVYLTTRDYPQKLETKRQMEDLENKIRALKKDEERQKNLVEYLNTESYLEKQARLRLNLKKEGEEVVFVYRKEEEPKEEISQEKNKNYLLSKLKEWFSLLIK